MSRKSLFSPVVLLLILLLAFLVYLYTPKQVGKSQSKRAPVPVQASEVELQEFVLSIEALGTAKANESVSISVQQTDVVQHLHFDDGQIVEQGQLLISLNSREEQAKVNELNVNLSEAKRQLRRITDLAKENVASAQLLDEQQARVKALKAQLDVAKSRLAELEVKAPFAGQLGIRQVSVGALLRPGDLVTTLDDLHLVKIDFSVSEQHLASLAVGQQLVANSVAYPDESFTGKVASIDPRIDPLTRAVHVRAVIDNPDFKLRPGMLLQLELQKQQLQALLIPEEAVIPINQQQFVYVVGKDMQVSRQEISIGHRKPGVVEVRSGLRQGDLVVVEGALKLKPGAKVKLLDAQSGAGVK